MTDREGATAASVDAINGLHHVGNGAFLSAEHQAALLQMIDLEGWFDEGTDQVMLFGTNNIPEWLLDLAKQLPGDVFPAEVRSTWPSPGQMSRNTLRRVAQSIAL
jgi:hypothetical protein